MMLMKMIDDVGRAAKNLGLKNFFFRFLGFFKFFFVFLGFF